MIIYPKTSSVPDGELPVKLNPDGDYKSFAVIGFGAVEVFAYTPADADRIIRAAIQAKSLLLGETSEPVPPAAELVPCKSVSGSASCSRLEGHELPHRNLGGVEWEDTAADHERKFIAPEGERCPDVAEHPADDDTTLICCKSAGHETAHYDHIDQAFWSVAADGHVTVAPVRRADGSRM